MRSVNKRITVLAQKWRSREISDQERQEFDAWYNAHDDTRIEGDNDETADELKERLYSNILRQGNINTAQHQPLIMWRRFSVAAAVLLALFAGGWLLRQHQHAEQQQAMVRIAPGGNKAVLTLANGKQVVLTDAKNGSLAKQGNMTITKTADGKVAYQVTGDVGGASTAYNTISTPRGGQYWITLADGTRVLLNASSSLKFPVTFTAADRAVELSGEAYFEVTHNAAHPFRVRTAGQIIEDIGTQFNVNAYNDEPDSRTTLLEGSVKLTSNGASPASILKPGQQAVLKDGRLTIAPANTEQVMAWKNGYFMFESESITSIMRRVSRWYNVEVVYDGAVPADKFGGTVNRFDNISQLLDKLELTGRVHFKVEGRRIMVSQ